MAAYNAPKPKELPNLPKKKKEGEDGTNDVPHM